MHTMPETEVFVTVGVDAHKDIHVAVALDQLGRILDRIEIPTTSAGYAELLAWASEFGTIDRVGIEGTGSHGAGLCRWLRGRGVVVVEVDRPDRRLRFPQICTDDLRLTSTTPSGASGSPSSRSWTRQRERSSGSRSCPATSPEAYFRGSSTPGGSV